MVEIRLALRKALALVGFQCCLLDFIFVERQHINALQALLFAGFERVDFAPEAQKRLIIRLILREKRRTAGVAVKIVDVVLLVEQLLAVVLAVNVDEIRRKQPQRCRGNRLHVDAAGAFAVRRDLALNMQRIRLLAREVELVEQRFERRRQLGEHRADKALFRAGANEVAADAPAENRADRVDDDTFARAGLAGEHGQTALQLDVRTLDHGNIFNVE